MIPKEIRVLIIEDEVSVAAILKEALMGNKDFQFQVEAAPSLRAGMDRLQQGGIDVVILDLGLPDSSGYETFTRFRAQHTNVPVVIITGTGDNQLAIKAVKEGAQDYLVKGQLDTLALPRTLIFAMNRIHSK